MRTLRTNLRSYFHKNRALLAAYMSVDPRYARRHALRTGRCAYRKVGR